MGHRAGLCGCGKSRPPPEIRSPDPSVAITTVTIIRVSNTKNTIDIIYIYVGED